MTYNIIHLDWYIGYHNDKESEPEEEYPARIPGAVQLDYARAHDWPPYWYGENFKAYEWMEDKFWTFRSRFRKPEFSADQRLHFISLGIDYEFTITLNGYTLLCQEGMFKPVKLDLTDYLIDTNDLRITIFPVPKSHRDSQDKSQANRSVKPPVSYGWDWHPRLIPLGIWDETYLQIKNKSHIRELDFSYKLSDNFDSAHITITVQGVKLDRKKCRWQLIDPAGQIVAEKDHVARNCFQIKHHLNDISLWWPYDHGEPDLYTLYLIIVRDDAVLDQIEKKIGFRRVRLVMNEGAWEKPDQFPKSRSIPPIQLEINGRSIFTKGSNWVPPEIFPGTITKGRYEQLIDLAVEAHFNMLRVWGGGIVNKESFYKYCDEKGVLVWQDFILACNNYEGTADYLRVLESEGRAIIKRVSQHPCLALWCGGNELFNEWSRMTDQALPLRLLNSLCYELDPDTPFIPTTPLMGMGHGHYVFRDRDSGEEVFQLMARSKNSAYTEFGVPAPSSIGVLESFIPQDERWPPQPRGVWESHHAYNAWQGDTWLMQHVIEHYFGPCENLEQLVEYGQILQSQGYKAIYEGARRQKPYCSMALNWCFNEPWPTAANNSLINWPAVKKPAFEAVKQACRPTLASAEIKKFVWFTGEEFECRLWILNDSYKQIAGGTLVARLVGPEKITLCTWDFPDIPANINKPGPTVHFRLPNFKAEYFQIFLHCPQNKNLDNSYYLLYKE